MESAVNSVWYHRNWNGNWALELMVLSRFWVETKRVNVMVRRLANSRNVSRVSRIEEEKLWISSCWIAHRVEIVKKISFSSEWFESLHPRSTECSCQWDPQRDRLLWSRESGWSNGWGRLSIGGWKRRSIAGSPCAIRWVHWFVLRDDPRIEKGPSQKW